MHGGTPDGGISYKRVAEILQEGNNDGNKED